MLNVKCYVLHVTYLAAGEYVPSAAHGAEPSLVRGIAVGVLCRMSYGMGRGRRESGMGEWESCKGEGEVNM
jgi:hypothetical protein